MCGGYLGGIGKGCPMAWICVVDTGKYGNVKKKAWFFLVPHSFIHSFIHYSTQNVELISFQALPLDCLMGFQDLEHLLNKS